MIFTIVSDQVTTRKGYSRTRKGSNTIAFFKSRHEVRQIKIINAKKNNDRDRKNQTLKRLWVEALRVAN